MIVTAFLPSSKADMDFLVLTQESVLLFHPSLLSLHFPREPLIDCREQYEEHCTVKKQWDPKSSQCKVIKHMGQNKTPSRGCKAAVHCSPIWATSCKVGIGKITVLKLPVKTTSVPPRHSSTPSF